MTIEDKKQQENLKNFDRNLKASTDQLAWFLYWMFAAVVLVLGMTLIFDGIFYRDAWLILSYVWMVVFMDNYVLAPYQWSNEAFSRRMPKIGCGFKNTSVCSGFGKKLHPCEDAVSLEVCVEIWRICHADRDRKHELYAKNFSCEGDGRCSFIFGRTDAHWVC